MSLTLVKHADATITAGKDKQFTIETRAKDGNSMIVSSTYNGVTLGDKPTFTATDKTRTLAVVYETDVAAGERVELWEVSDTEEQLIRYRYHHPGRSYFALQIN